MITIYAETTFVLGHAHRQDGGGTDQILDATRQGKIKLVVPILSLFEALYHWRGKQQELRKQLEMMDGQADELARSEEKGRVVRHDAADALRKAALKLAPVGDDDRNAIGKAIDEIAQCAEVLQIPIGTFARAKEYEALVKGPADALVFALILGHATANPAASDRFFLTLDTGFAEPLPKARLKAAGIAAVRTIQKLLQILQARGAL